MIGNLTKNIFAFGVICLLASCSKTTEKTVIQYMPHMANTPILKAQRGYDGLGNGASVMMPPENAIARNHKPYRIESPEEADRVLKNPLAYTESNLERGRKIYNIYCMVCHGDRGHGDGPVVNPFPIPKSLQSEDMLRWGDGHLFHVITKGQGVMPAYAQQVQPEDRWAVILYVRALQRADHPTQDDVRELKKKITN
ncbi:MAG: cytochrome c [Oligoflexia bacterium]|nr:cytochrome c [Oligoflexia bacterium]